MNLRATIAVAFGCAFTLGILGAVAQQGTGVLVPGFSIRGAVTPGNCVALDSSAVGHDAGAVCGTSAVTSVFGRSGAVVAANNDYAFSQISGSLGCGQMPALSGDVSNVSCAITIVANAITTTKINNSAVTYGKIQNETALTLLGNPTGLAAAPSEITLGATLAFSASALQTTALSGDVTSSANSFATTIANNAVTTVKINAGAVTYGKIQNESAVTLLGNPTGGAAAPSEITLGATLAFSASALQTGAGSGDVTWSANSFATTISANAVTTGKINAGAVTYAKIQNETANTILGNPTAGAAAPSELTMPSCSGANQALNYTTSGGATAIGCASISGSGTVTSVIAGADLSGGTITTTGTIDVSYIEPGGRLTLTSATPVMTASASAQTTIYYAPYKHMFVPVYDGTNLKLRQFTANDTDAVGASIALGTNWAANSNFDVFFSMDAGTLRMCTGPAWTSDTGRGSGAGTTELQLFRGFFTNKNSMTCRYNNTTTITAGVNQATYVGTFRTTASTGTTQYVFGASAAGGTAGAFYVWNMYNRVTVATSVQDSTSAYTYSTATVRAADNSATMRVTYIAGINEEAALADYDTNEQTSTGTNMAIIGICVDVTNAFIASGTNAQSNSAAVVHEHGQYRGLPGLGLHFISACEKGSGTVTQTFNTLTTEISALTVILRL